MSKTAGKKNEAKLETKTILERLHEPLTLPAIFSVMRALKRVNPGDAYLENYEGMRRKYEDFFDTYQLLWCIGSLMKPKRILEIGTRTGISLCQLLFAHGALETVEHIVCVDPFDQWTSPNLVRANLAYLGLPNNPDTVKIHPITSDEYFKSFETHGRPIGFDYILVDGDHSKVQARKDLDNAEKLVAPGGIIVFDDISTAPGECALIDVWEGWKADNAGKFTFNHDLRGKGVAWAVKK